MKRKKIFCLLLAVVMFAYGFSLNIQPIQAADPVRVVLDGKTLSFTVSPQIINERTMVPFRAIGESMGASVAWDDQTKKVTMYLHSNYVILFIDNPIMTYGTFSLGTTGDVTFTSTATLMLDAPPKISNGYTLVPLRVIAEGLGATVDWDSTSRTAYITSPIKPTPPPTPTPSPTPTPTPAPTPTPYNTLFNKTNYFEEISARRAQSMYDDNSQFILAYYSSQDANCIAYMEMIINEARTQGSKIFGVDRDSPNYDNSGNALTFVRDYSYNYRTYLPTLCFVNGRDDVEILTQPKNRTVIDDAIYTFWKKVISPTPSPTPDNSGSSASPTPTPTATLRPTPSATPNLDANLYSISREQSTTMYNNGRKFIYVCYHSQDTDSQLLFNVVKQASINANVDIYVTDSYSTTIEEAKDWWGKTVLGNPVMYYPTVFFVYDQDVVNPSIQPQDVSVLTDAFINFSK